MRHETVLIVTDNPFLFSEFRRIARERSVGDTRFDFVCSPSSAELFSESIAHGYIAPMVVKESAGRITSEYDLVISLHCKQLFPPSVVAGVKCINVHPGLNPFNRGWYPQVFAILNKMPHGATIHEIDDELDHGPIIGQQRVQIEEWDTSLSAYEKVQIAELGLIEKYLEPILSGDYEVCQPQHEGNVNYQADFKAILELDRTERGTLGDFIDRLRALSHGDYRNAFFRTSCGKKVYVRLSISTEE